LRSCLALSIGARLRLHDMVENTKYQLAGWFIEGERDPELNELSAHLETHRKTTVLSINMLNDDLRYALHNTHKLLEDNIAANIYNEGIKCNIRLAWDIRKTANGLAIGRKFGNSRFIVITFSTIEIVLDFFLDLLSSPTFMPHIGNVNLETSGGKISIHNDCPTKRKLPSRVPKCPVRFLFAHFTKTIAIQFLLNHEFAHIANGHVGIKEIISEADNSNDGSFNLSSHTLEMDADSAAVGKTFNYMKKSIFLLSPETVGYNLFAPDMHKLRDDLGVDTYSVGLLINTALAGMFIIFGSPDEKPIYSGDHPHSFLRLIMSTNVLAEYIKRDLPDFSFEKFNFDVKNIFDSIIAELDTTDQWVVSYNPVLDFIEKGGVGEYVSKLNKHWRDVLYDELNSRKLTKFNLAPKYNY
jgi:hypothetical protein